MIYLDYAAATPLDPIVLEAMQPYLSEQFYNPSAQYLAAQTIAKDVQAARTRVAHWLGARQSEITFTSGGTEANNLAIRGIMETYPDAKVLVSAIEHESVLAPAKHYDYAEIPVDQNGIVNLQMLADVIDDKTVLVSVMYANNEVGTIQPIRPISSLIAEVRRSRLQRGIKLPLLLHTDACQAANYLDLHAARLGVDLMTINGGKIYGPKQSGALYIKAGVTISPQILGGGQEKGLRSGTENVAGIMGFVEALDGAQSSRHEESKRLQELQRAFIKLLKEKVPNIEINGSEKHRLPNNVHATIPGQDNERLIFGLDELGILCAAGSACSASKEEASHVLLAMGLSEEQARASLRFTLGRKSTLEHIEATVTALLKVL
jgi:cysteine desulfurase